MVASAAGGHRLPAFAGLFGVGADLAVGSLGIPTDRNTQSIRAHAVRDYGRGLLDADRGPMLAPVGDSVCGF
ncbi:MAG: hypothetical protein P8K76_16215 [Candidatus Binatia bacterium]|nr:hypothetical protein [Candidatus Binatia bacterium]MDG2011305.1 hypothetical protein [Candidatus Binatia bacterium]